VSSSDTPITAPQPVRAGSATLDIAQQTVGIIGGTGPQGRGLAYRLARAGQPVAIGSRLPERARGAASELGFNVTGHSNREVARHSDIVIVTVPWEGHAATLKDVREDLAGKLVIDSVNPLGFDSRGAYALRPDEGSAAEQAAALLPEARLTAAFHHLSATLLTDPGIESIETDVLVLGEDRADTDTVQALIDRIPGMRGIYAGRLRNAHQVEALVANLISVNRRYKAHVGVRITDL
jgi:NADPH-dependent F420 reductase